MVERMAKESGPEAGPDGNPINLRTEDGVLINNVFYKFKQVPVSELIAMMANVALVDMPVDWSETAYPHLEEYLKKDSFKNLTLGTFAQEADDFTGIFGTDDPFLIELDIPWDQTQWAGMEEKFANGENLELRFSEIDEDPPVVQQENNTETEDATFSGDAVTDEFDPESGYKYTRAAFANAVLEAMGADTSRGTIEALVAWMGKENTKAGFNPLATTLDYGENTWFNTFGDQGQYHVRNYADFQTGVEATVRTLRGGYYPKIIEALMNGTDADTLGTGEQYRQERNTWGGVQEGQADYTFDSSLSSLQYMNTTLGTQSPGSSFTDDQGGLVTDNVTEDVSAEDVYTLLQEQFGGAAYFFEKNKQDMQIGILADGSPTSYRDPDAVDLQDITEYLVENDITALTRVSGLLKLTEWWQTTDVQMREFDIAVADMNDLMLQEYLEPTIDVLRKEAQFLGIQLEASELFDLAYSLKRFGDSEDAEAIRIAMAGQLRYQDTISEISSFQANIDKVQQEAYKYYTPMDDEAAQEWAELLYTGEATETELDQYLKATAVARFPTLDRIVNEMGVTPTQYFSPYKYQIEQMLGRSNIDMLEEFPDVIEFMPDSGNARPMTLSEVREFVRGLPEWQQSEDGKSQARALAFSIGQTFGEVG